MNINLACRLANLETLPMLAGANEQVGTYFEKGATVSW